MRDLIWLIPALPFAGFLLLALAGRRLPRPAIAVVGAGSVGLSAALVLALFGSFIASPPPGHVAGQRIWTWMQVGDLRPEIAFHVDPLSLVMMLVITGVGFLIHLYSTEYMQEDADYARFFASMNLFVGSMLVLVLADNFVLLYLGWEGVGLCSYLLIGFWYKDPANGRAARKAFLVTRVGDTAMAIGLFLIFSQLGTLQIQQVLARAASTWEPGSAVAVAAAALLLGGALGKSAQLPLQTWLPDAMAGPTPVSALIHAATMVTAGAYLIARTHTLFALAPQVMAAVAIIGALTLLLAGFAALAQRDIKRILAYSTISQIGYMFLALGVGAWSAAILHLMTHAFFKALLFLGAGAVILSVHHEQDIFRMGGLKERLPAIYWTFVIGSAALAGLPLVTAGFYSKDLILASALASDHGSIWLWGAGLLGALLTSIYIFRLVFIAFHGEARTEVSHVPGARITLPLLVLALLSLIGGLVEIPPALGDLPFFSRFMEHVLPAAHVEHHGIGFELALMGAAAAAALGGIFLAAVWFLRPHTAGEAEDRLPFATAGLQRFWMGGWGFDRLYDLLLVRPFVAAARINKGDFVDSIYGAIAGFARAGHATLALTQTGRLRWYAAWIATGTILLLALVIWR